MPIPALRTLDPHRPSLRIDVEGRAEVRVDPDAIRVVFAVCTEAASADAARTTNSERVGRLLTELRRAGAGDADLHVDFIASLPVYDWAVSEEGGRRLAREQLVGWRLQENVHVAVRDQAGLDAAKQVAAAAGVHDVLAVDYGSTDLEKQRQRAIESALAVARGKAAILLADFPTPPKLVDVAEDTKVVPPHLLYRSFENAHATRAEFSYRDDTVRLHAFRPKNTLYEGYQGDVDRPGGALPMRPQIVIVSAVRLSFESPEAKRAADAIGDERKPDRK
ncbi:MAG: SIMPL domain-containing protein [Planctomycetota bacterium]